MTPFLANDRVEAFYLDINSDEFKVTVQYHQDFCWMIWVWRKLSGMSWGKSSTSSHFLKIKLASCCQNSPKPKKPSKWLIAYDFYSPTTSHPITHPKTPHRPLEVIRRFANTQGLSSAGSLLWSQNLAFTSGCHGAIVVAPKVGVFSYQKHLWFDGKNGRFLGGICFFSLKRATKNIWYSTGCYCNVFVHTSLGRQSSKTSANQWRWIRLPGRFPWKFGNTQNRKVRFCSIFLNQ